MDEEKRFVVYLTLYELCRSEGFVKTIRYHHYE